MLLPGSLCICRLSAQAEVPEWALPHPAELFVSITRTNDELSIVCPSELVPPETRDDPSIKLSDGWRCLRIAGTLDLALTGVLSSILTPLAQAGISVFTISTFDTDYLLVRATDLARTRAVLRSAGHPTKDAKRGRI